MSSCGLNRHSVGTRVTSTTGSSQIQWLYALVTQLDRVVVLRWKLRRFRLIIKASSQGGGLLLLESKLE